MAKILFCKTCKEYTLEKNCTTCGEDTVNPVPAKFSLKDKYGKYRRVYKKSTLKEK